MQGARLGIQVLWRSSRAAWRDVSGREISPSIHFVSFAEAELDRGAGFDVVWKDCAVIALLGLAFFSIALVRFRHMVAQMQT